MSVTVRPLVNDEIELIRLIDRTEHVDVEYAVVDGRLLASSPRMPEIPAWDPTGDGPHSFSAIINLGRASLENGGRLLGAYVGEELAGLAVVEPSFEPPLAWLSLLHVSRPHRRTGAGTALWVAVADMAREAAATHLYVSATPTGSAVNFYLRQGCVLANPPHPTLFELEPEDIHLTLTL